MITCYLRYEIAAGKVADFEVYARRWMPLVEEFGGTHHGYYVTHESASDLAVALFSFPSLAAYEQYRQDSERSATCQDAYRFAEESGCISRYERQFLRPVERSSSSV